MLSPINLLLDEHKRNLKAFVKSEGHYATDGSGDWIPGDTTELNFSGVILPLSSKDMNQLQITSPGLFSVDDRKLYVEGQQRFLNTTQITDIAKNVTYQIYAISKDYDDISDLKVYYIKRIEKVAQ